MRVDVDVHIGRRIRRRRRLIGMTQSELATIVGCRFQQIQKYECAANRTNSARLWEIAEALGVPISHFYEGLSGTRLLPSEEAETPGVAEMVAAYSKLSETTRQRLLSLTKAMSGEQL